ncbi:MAG: hypothetical protein R3222_05605 [Balneolaceae bacterium]|nr:hypothetical protein [Balneolaceae bacterium]
MKTAITSPSDLKAFDIEPLLRKAFLEAEEEHKELQEIFALMGWEDLPDALKVEIKDDVASMVEELRGQYSSCDPYVKRRRQSVTYWVNCYKDGICSLSTAIQALKVKSL